MSDSDNIVIQSPAPAPAPAVEIPLRRNHGFQLLWAGSVPAFLGREISTLVYPLVVLALTGSPGWAGAFGGVQIFTSLLFGIPAGELADRFDQRRLLLLVEAVRSIATVTVAIAYFMHALTLAQLLIVAVIIGAVQPLGGSSRSLLLRSLVPKSQFTAALTQEDVRSQAAAMAGPPLGGFLFAIAKGLPFVLTASGFAIAFACTLFVRPPASAARTAAAAKSAVDGMPRIQRMLVGLRVLWGEPLLRSGMLFAAALNAVGAPITLVVVVLLQHQGMPSGTIGLVAMALAVGGLAGASLVRPLHRRFAPGALMLGIGASEVLLTGLMVLPWGPWWLAGVLLLRGLSGATVRVLVDILIFRQVPDGQRGQVMAAFMTVLGAGSSLGILGCGLLLQMLSAETAVLALTAFIAVALCVGLGSRTFRGAAWPADDPLD